MDTATRKITNGIPQVGRGTPSKPQSLDQRRLIDVTASAKYQEGDQPLDPDGLARLRKRIEEHSASVVQASKRVGERVDTAGAKAKAEAQERFKTSSLLSAAAVSDLVQRAVAEQTQAVRQSVAAELNLQHRLDELQRHRASIEAVAAAFEHPSRVLSRVALETPRRANLMASIGTSVGATEQVELARQAHQANDVVLAAVVCTIASRTPRDKRLLDLDRFAERFVGERCRAVQNDVQSATVALDQAQAKVLEALTGVPERSFSKIERGIRARAVEEQRNQ